MNAGACAWLEAAYAALNAIRGEIEALRAAQRETKPETRGGPSYQGLILTRADSRIRSLADLKGKTFCYVNKGSTSGYLYPRALLRQAGLDPDTDFASKSFGHDHLNTLRLLDRGECQGAAVYAKILETGSKHGMLRVAATGPHGYETIVRFFDTHLRAADLALTTSSAVTAE